MPEERHPHQDPVEDRLRRVNEYPREDHGEQFTATPRANPESDDYDVERGREKLSRVVGN